MNRFAVSSFLAVMSCTLIPGCASNRDGSMRGSEVRIRYAEVVDIRRTDLPSAAPAGAIVGGFTGLALSRKLNPGRQLASGVGGALLGGLATKALEGERRGYAYRLAYLNGGETDFITEKGYLEIGDCVSVETGVHKNIRRVASTICANSGRVKVPVAMHQQNAEQCHQAKEQLLLAQGEQIDQAARKVEIICHF